MKTTRLIEKNYWSQFIQPECQNLVAKKGNCESKHDGQKFEDLVEDLLNLEYGNITWERTQTTHDGNKDFKGKCDEETLWAECKNYKTKIDLKTLAATLVMAEIQDVNSIFFFCYSEINKNTKTKLNSFAVSTQKNIFFFDGVVLDQLILKHKEIILPKYFPEFYKDIKKQQILCIKQSPIALCYVERAPFFNGVADFDIQTLPELQNLKFGEVIGIHIIIINTNLDRRINCSIELVFAEGELFFEVLSKNEKLCERVRTKDIELSAGMTKKITLYLRLQSQKSKVSLPQIICKSEKKRIATFTFSTISTLRTRQTALLGSSYVEKKEELCKACMNQKKLSIIYIYGSGGTGKSRMVTECSMAFVANGYRVLRLVNSKYSQHSTYTMLKEIIFLLYGFNDELIEYVVHNSFEELESYGKGTYREVSKIIKAIYDNRYSLSQIKSIDYTILYEKMAKGNYFIIVDDIQYWDDYAVSFLKEFYNYTLNMNRKCNVVIAIAANTDFLYNRRTAEFLAELEYKNTDFDKNIYSYNVSGFENINQSYMFLKEILGITDDFEELKELTAFSKKPKYLVEVANYLLDKKAIEIVSNKAIVADKEFLKMLLRTLPKSLHSLLLKRWLLYLKEVASNEDDYKRIITSILFLGSIEIDNNSLWIKYREEIESLHCYGFLKRLESRDNVYGFEHDTIKNFFQEYYNDWFEIAISYLNDSNTKFLKANNLEFICLLYKSKSITLKNYHYYVDLNISNDIKYKMNKYILVSILKYGADNIFSIVQDILHNTREQFGEKNAEVIYELFERTYDIDSKQLTCNEYCVLLMAYAENQLKLKSTEKSIKLYNRILAIINKRPFEGYQYLIAQIYNRFFVCGRIGGSMQQYEEKWKLSMNLAIDKSFWDVCIENYFDKAQSFFLDVNSTQTSIALLKKGCSKYRKHHPRGMKGQYLYRCIQLSFLQKDYVSLKNTIWEYEEEILNDNEIEFKLYFRIQFLIFKIMFCLMKQCTYTNFEM